MEPFTRENFVLTDEDKQHGNTNWLLYTLSEHLEPNSLASAMEATFQHHVDPTELTVDGGAVPFGPRTATWRTLARIAVVGTDVPRKTLEEMSVAKKVTASMLGRCLPAQATISKQFDGFRSVAVAVSIHLDRVVTPSRARRIFDRTAHQGFQLTPYGKSLFERCQKSWPPCPEAAATYTQPVFTATPLSDLKAPPSSTKVGAAEKSEAAALMQLAAKQELLRVQSLLGTLTEYAQRLAASAVNSPADSVARDSLQRAIYEIHSRTPASPAAPSALGDSEATIFRPVPSVGLNAAQLEYLLAHQYSHNQPGWSLGNYPLPSQPWQEHFQDTNLLAALKNQHLYARAACAASHPGSPPGR
mmetsp:Transcript_5410/g.13687  ORF Transcript_5410/g.13687 Transcript_5410/m.13687 type:complete len:359 (+) Transcript_5410:246-1322(+)